MKNDNTLKTLGVSPDKLSRVRAKAKDTESTRYRSKRTRTQKKPTYKIDEEVVLVTYNRDYTTVKVVDTDGHLYYGVVVATTKKAWENRIGCLTHFTDGGWDLFYSHGSPAKVPADSIKWLFKMVEVEGE